MNTYSSDGPLRIGGYRLGVTHLLIVIHCATMVLCALLKAAEMGGVLGPLIFDSDAVLRGSVWQLFTYLFVNMPSLWFAVEMLMLYWFGKALEESVGRGRFVMLYLALTLLPAVALSVLGLRWPQVLVGSGLVHFGLFLAYATLNPRAMIFGVLSAWIVALVFLGIDTLQCLAAHVWTRLGALWITAAAAYWGTRFLGGGGGFDWWERWTMVRHRWRMARQQRDFARQKVAEESVDRILGKISRQGMGSLSTREKRILENARTRLLRKD